MALSDLSVRSCAARWVASATAERYSARSLESPSNAQPRHPYAASVALPSSASIEYSTSSVWRTHASRVAALRSAHMATPTARAEMISGPRTPRACSCFWDRGERMSRPIYGQPGVSATGATIGTVSANMSASRTEGCMDPSGQAAHETVATGATMGSLSARLAHATLDVAHSYPG